jgi:hypothetical protein
MSDETEMPDSAARAFGRHDAFERLDDAAFELTTSAFGGRVTAAETDSHRLTYTVTVSVPTLEAATADEVGDAVAGGWLDTLERRLEDVPQSTRADVDLAGFDVEADGAEVFVTFQFAWGNADRAAGIAKTFAEYVEGTYVESVVPGYSYEGTVASLLSSASQGGDGETRGGTPL